MARATTIRFSGPVYERLERASKYTGLPINAIVTAACLDWLKEQLPPALDVDTAMAPSETDTLKRAVDDGGRKNWLRFASDARDAMAQALNEARRFNHGYIGTEHLLAGIAAEETGTGAQALEQLGIDLKRIRESIGFIVGRGTGTKAGEPGLTPRAKQVIELAVEEAGRRGDASVDSGHLLLGICAEGEGLAMGIITSLGGSAEAIRAVIH